MWTLTGLLLVAINLRPAVTSVGALLDELRDGLGMSAALAGLLTTLPVICFAGFGSLAPTLARRLGVHRVVFGAVLAIVLGLGSRVSTDSAWVFVAASALALVGMATGNVLLPVLVKEHFPNRIGWVTALYSAALMAGSALPGFVSIPLTEATGSWRSGLGVWALTALVAALPWLSLLRHDIRTGAPEHAGIPWAALARTRLAWAMAMFFGLQSTFAYTMFGWMPAIFRAGGLSPHEAATMLGIFTLLGVPVPLLLPVFTRTGDQRPIVALLGLLTAGGLTGLLLAPAQLPWLWAIMLGLGGGFFPWVLTMLGLRTRTAPGTVALSGFVQSVGYLLAAPGPVLVGVLAERTGSWTLSLLLMLGASVPLAVLGWTFARPRVLEDELPQPPTS